MTRQDVLEYVRGCDEDGGPESREEAAEMFTALLGCEPDAELDQGTIWSAVCDAAKVEPRDRADEAACEGDYRHDEERDWRTVHGGDRG